jgi:hypothetical protein
MAAWLATQGHVVNRKRVQRLTRLMGLAAIYQRPNTSKPAAAHKVYPYLLGGIVLCTRVADCELAPAPVTPDQNRKQRIAVLGGAVMPAVRSRM